MEKKRKGKKSVFNANGHQKKARLAKFISERIDFKIKPIIRDQEGHKSSNQKDYITIVNIYSTKIGAPQYKRQIIKAIKEKLNSNTVILGNFNTPLHQWTGHPDRISTGKQRPSMPHQTR